MLKLAIEKMFKPIDAEERKTLDWADMYGAKTFFDAILRHYNLNDVSAIDMFARDGMLTVPCYADHVRDLTLWEINEVHEAPLRKRFPEAYIKIGCAFRNLLEEQQKYGLIVVDSPQGLYPDYAGHVHTEHFDLLPMLPKIMEDHCLVVVYVNQAPYNKEEVGQFGRDVYEDAYSFDRWMDARAEFYGRSGRKVPLRQHEALNAYDRLFASVGYELATSIMTPCFEFGPGLPKTFRLCMELKRK